jgi:hypothetical protein
MENFRRVEVEFLDFYIPLLRHEVRYNKTLWLVNQNRQREISHQRHTQSIFLRTIVKSAESPARLNDIHESAATRHAKKCPAAMELLQRLANHLQGELSRALYVRLSPHSVVYSHVDAGSYYECRDRYHVIVDSPGGSAMRCGAEEITMRSGELWWFNNKLAHESANSSTEWRVHLIFDLLPIASREVRGNTYSMSKTTRRTIKSR